LSCQKEVIPPAMIMAAEIIPVASYNENGLKLVRIFLLPLIDTIQAKNH
jgi:hypothetical protein